MADAAEPAESTLRRWLRPVVCKAITAVSPVRKAVGVVGHWLGRLLPGAAARRVQTATFAAEWELANTEALAADGPLWVVLGDSTSQGIGASTRDGGYVLRVLERLRSDGRPWRVVNLSKTGARAADVLGRQLPALAEIAERTPPELVSVAIGSNDLVHRTADLHAALRKIAARLPAGALIATMPHGLRPPVAQQMNALVADEAARHGLRVADLWSRTGPPWRDKYSADFFHPNDRGYGDWTAAFLDALDRPVEQSAAQQAPDRQQTG